MYVFSRANLLCYKFFVVVQSPKFNHRSSFFYMLLTDVTYFFSVSDIVFYGAFTLKAMCIIVVFEEEVYIFDVLFTVHVKK